MEESIFDLANANPGVWIRDEDCSTDEQLWDLAETGGLIKLCTTCNLHGSPNRPCFCGAIVLQREDGKYWSTKDDKSSWTTDWKYEAKHFWSDDNARTVAEVLKADHGNVNMIKIQ